MSTFPKRVLLLILSCCLWTACSSSRPLGSPFPEGYTSESERIEVRTKDGEVVTTRRIEIRDDSLFTDRQAIDLLEIESITERRFSPENSYLLIGGVTLAALGVVVIGILVDAYARGISYIL